MASIQVHFVAPSQVHLCGIDTDAFHMAAAPMNLQGSEFRGKASMFLLGLK